MDLRELIEKKKQGFQLSTREIQNWIAGRVVNRFPNYQTTALLMAIVLKGMSHRETVDLTREMARHGISLARPKGIKRIGKHSTGGVGDKATFILAPLVASYGVQIPFMSGRGLGHTGGTIDKLSGISGIKTQLTPRQVEKMLQKYRFCIFEQSKHFAPADQKLYALRDASATVDSIPLIVSSILSKKLQEGLHGLLLDVKYGSGAIMETLPQAQQLARELLLVAKALKLKATAVLSAMDQPLGMWVGNNLEIQACLQAMRGQGAPDLVKLNVHLAREILKLALPAKKVPSLKEIRLRLTSGELIGPFLEGVRAQGGKKQSLLELPHARNVFWLRAPKGGWVQAVQARIVGEAAMHLGAGRKVVGGPIDPTVGFKILKKVGDRVKSGEPWAAVYFNKRSQLEPVEKHLAMALKTGPKKPHLFPLIARILKNH